jgi:hypothetical protein
MQFLDGDFSGEWGRGQLPVINKNDVAFDIQVFEWYSISISKKPSRRGLSEVCSKMPS